MTQNIVRTGIVNIGGVFYMFDADGKLYSYSSTLGSKTLVADLKTALGNTNFAADDHIKSGYDSENEVVYFYRVKTEMLYAFKVSDWSKILELSVPSTLLGLSGQDRRKIGMTYHGGRVLFTYFDTVTILKNQGE